MKVKSLIVIIILLILGAIAIGANIFQIKWEDLKEYHDIGSANLQILETDSNTSGNSRLTKEEKKTLEDFEFIELQTLRKELTLELKSIIKRLEVVEKSVKNVETLAKVIGNEPNSESAAKSLQALRERLDVLDNNEKNLKMDERLEFIETQIKDADKAQNNQTQLIKDVRSRVSVLESQKSKIANGAVSHASALILAIGDLRSIIRQGKPYARELANTIALLPEDFEGTDTMTALHRHSNIGVSSQTLLRDRFSAVAVELLRAEQLIVGDDFISKIVNRFSELFIIRRVDEGVHPGSVDEIIMRIEKFLEIGDLEAAARTIGALKSSTSVGKENWLKDLNITLDVEQALTKLNAEAIRQLSNSQDK